MQRVIIYSRKSEKVGSTEEAQEEKNTLSLSSQKRELTAYAKAQGWNIIGEYCENESAYKPGRPIFDAIMRMFEEGKADILLVYHLNRIARNPVDGGRVVYFVDEKYIDRIATLQKHYRNTPDDKFIMGMEFLIAKKSSDDSSVCIQRDFKTKIEQNGEFPGPVPLGYLNMTPTGSISAQQFDSRKQILLEQKGRPLKRIEIDPVFGPIIQAIFQDASKGIYTIRELCQRSALQGLRSRSAQKVGKTVLSRILRNPFYYGAFHYNGHLYTENIAHEPLISKGLWNLVQRALDGRGFQKKEKVEYLFTATMKCAECTGNISSQLQKGHRYYHCTRWRHKSWGKDCDHRKYYREEWLEGEITKKLRAVTLHPDFIQWSKEVLKHEQEQEMLLYSSERQSLQHQLQILTSKKENLLNLKLSPANKTGALLDDQEFLDQKMKYQTEIAEILHQLETSKPEYWFDQVDEFFQFSATLSAGFEHGDPSAKREILTTIGHPLLNHGKLTLELKKPYVFLPEINDFWKSNIVPSEPPLSPSGSHNRRFSRVSCPEWRTVWGKIRTFFRNCDGM